MLQETGQQQKGRRGRPGGRSPAVPRPRGAQARPGTPKGKQPTGVIERAWQACYTSHYRTADQLFRQALDSSEAGPAEVACGLSAVRRALGRPAEAKLLIEQALQHDSVPALRRELGYIAYDQRRFRDAEAIFDQLAQEDLAQDDPVSVRDWQWQAASLRRQGNYQKAAKILGAVPQQIRDDPHLDVERGWIAYRCHKIQSPADFRRAAGHFCDAKAHAAPPDLFVPPLVVALLRMGEADAAWAEAGSAPLTSPIASARADVHVHNGYPEYAIKLLGRLGSELDEEGIRQLVALLHGADRDEEARKVLHEWLRGRCAEEDGAPTFASPGVVATWIEVTGRRPGIGRGALCAQIRAALARYDGSDPVPVVVAASAISTVRNFDKAEAMRIARERIAEHPNSSDLLIESAKTSFALANYSTALEQLDQIIAKEPDHDRALQWRCRSMRRLGQWHDLGSYLADKIALLERSPRLQIELGWLRLTRGDYRGARRAFCEALRLDKSSQQALFGQISALRKMQRCDEARRMLAEWKEKWPHSNRRRLAEAMLSLDYEDYRGSMGLFREAGGVSGLLGQASVLTQQGDAERARVHLEKALELDPGRPGAKIALAMLLVQGAERRGRSVKEAQSSNEADWSRANELCDRAKDWGAESDAAALACQAQVALDKGQYRAAESLLRDARDRNPYGTHLSALASVLVGMHRIDEAVNMLNEHLGQNGRDGNRSEGNESDSSAYFQLYRALMAWGDSKAALSALRTALALAPFSAGDTLAVALAYELEEQGSSAEAERLLRDRLVGRNTSSDDLLRLGRAWILLSRGDRAQSPAMLQEAVAEATQVLVHPDPRSATVHPETVAQDALKCRGTAYYKLAEHERRPGERSRLAYLARRDQGDQARVAKEKAPRRSRWRPRRLQLDTGLRMLVLAAGLALTAVLWVLHEGNQAAWTDTMVMSLTPLFLGVVLLAALLPQLQSLKLAGLQAQTRDAPDVPLPTSPSVVLPLVTEFAAIAHENFIDAVDVSDLVGTGTSSTPLDPSGERRLKAMSAGPAG